MLPAFTATDGLARFVSGQAQHLSDAERTLSQHGFDTDGYALSSRVIALYDVSIVIYDLAEDGTIRPDNATRLARSLPRS